MKRLLLTITIFFSVLITSEGRHRHIFSQISIKEGLTSTVNCICKEKDGEVWIGTPNGLYSFNGYALKHYDIPLFKGCKVYQTSFDKDDNLWVLTNKCLAVKYANSDTFSQLVVPDNYKNGPFYSLVFGNDCVWIGAVGRIYKYNYDNRDISLFCTMPEGFDCKTMCQLNPNTILTCSRRGKYLINTENGDISEANFGNISEVTATLVDSKGLLWMSFYNNGIQVFNKNGEHIRRYNTQNSALSNNIVLCLAEKEGSILAGTEGGGINIINTETGKIEIMSNISGDPYSFPAHSIKSLYIDEHQNVWAGSIRVGLIKIGLSEIMTYLDTNIGFTDGLSHPSILSLYQEPESKYLWIGTDGEGINRFDPETRQFRHYHNTLKKKIVSIASYSEDELVLSVYSDNVLLLNKNTGETKPLSINHDALNYLIKYTDKNMNLYNENDGGLLLISNTVYRYNKKNGSCFELQMPEGKKADDYLQSVGRTDEGVWLHDQYHIYFLPNGSEKLELKVTYGDHGINSAHLRNNDNSIWLATEEGLCSYSIEDGTTHHINTNLYLEATSVVCDNSSRVWIGTEDGLYAYLTRSGRFALFGKSDGVEPNEFIPEPHLLATNGDIYFGGINGLLHIESTYTIDTSEDPIIRLNDVSIDGETISLESGESLEVPRGSKTITLSVSTLERDIFRHKAYRFQLSKEKIYETTRPTLTLNQLPPGKYDISVSCTRRDGEWSTPVKVMTLTVPKPWYLTWWFISGCSLLVIFTFIIILVSNNRKKAQELKMAVKEQEQKVFEEKVSLLINISHELRTPLTLIMAPLKRLLKDMTPQQEQDRYDTLSRVYRQSRRMKNLLDMVLDLRKKEVMGDRLKLEQINYNSWLEENVKDIMDEEKVVGINIECELDPEVDIAEIDKQKCDIVLMNILINAIKHSSNGDTITIKTRMMENNIIRTSISDQGPGLAEDVDVKQIFTTFYQSANEQYGSGIGLSYSKILLEMHGGSIGVENNQERGATFWWEIPAQQSNPERNRELRAYINELLGHSSEAELPANCEETSMTSNMKIMLVDDNQDLLDFLKEALEQHFAEIITATGGKQAMRILENSKLPSIIISDVNMPEGDGFWLCNELKNNQKYCHIPIILLTARGEDQSQSTSYRLGADAFMAKPFEIETLIELIRNMIRSKAEIKKKYLDSEGVSYEEYGSDEERFILQLNKIIDEHISNPNLDQVLICKELGVSRALLYNKMKAITGGGAKEYITKIRIEKAKALIENTSLSIAEISDMTGFASQSYFSTAFKNYTGMTPSQYKQTSKPNKNETV